MSSVLQEEMQSPKYGEAVGEESEDAVVTACVFCSLNATLAVNKSCRLSQQHTFSELLSSGQQSRAGVNALDPSDN